MFGALTFTGAEVYDGAEAAIGTALGIAAGITAAFIIYAKVRKAFNKA